MLNLSQFPLPFERDTLEPYMSQTTVDFHYGKHLATYINNLNNLIPATPYEKLPLREIIMKSAADRGATKIFNNAAQIFNHDFFFHCLRRTNGDNTMPDEIARTFGGADAFKSQFKSVAIAVFGSGWAWLVRGADGKLSIMPTVNADTPMVHGVRPILTLDVWEHAYYLDYQNRRGDFIDAFLNNMVNWDFVAENLSL